MTDVRVRFAPSPTGELHIGGARTTLFNWLFARKHGGKMVLRIDDTDKQRSSPEFLKTIFTSLNWLGLDWDEGPEVGGEYGPYFQSERLEIYHSEAQRLIKEGKAYYCFCTPEELQAEKEERRLQGLPPRYSGKCRRLSPEERKEKMAGQSFVIRILAPEEGQTIVDDLIRGPVVFENDLFDDFIIMKSDGLPTYNFASVIDDAKMEITHVIRGEEHLSNTPRQQIIARQLGYSIPRYAHVPMILAPDHTKLSKRHGATSVHEYREMGILPEALINYLALLGWSPGEDREIMSMDELIDSFSLEKVSKNPAIYDLKKLIWLNGHYLRTMELETIVLRALPFFEKDDILSEKVASYQEKERNRIIEKVVDLVRDRVKTLQEVVEASDYFFRDDFAYNPKGVEKHFRHKNAVGILDEIIKTLSQVEPFAVATIKEELEGLSRRLNVSLGQINLPVRLAVTGRTMGPDLLEIISFLGRDEVLARLKRAKQLLIQS